jgi:hypothetical protein
MSTICKAAFSLRLNIPGTFDVRYVYTCQRHTQEYESEMGGWVARKRPVSTLKVDCNRCLETAVRHGGK